MITVFFSLGKTLKHAWAFPALLWGMMDLLIELILIAFVIKGSLC